MTPLRAAVSVAATGLGLLLAWFFGIVGLWGAAVEEPTAPLFLLLAAAGLALGPAVTAVFLRSRGWAWTAGGFFAVGVLCAGAVLFATLTA